MSQQPQTAQPRRFEALDSLRGLCACMVLLLHFETTGMISRSNLVRNSFLFVDFFFVLSGFVIAASYGEKLASGFSIRRFMGLRMGRIYPLHAAMLLLFLLFEILFAAAGFDSAGRRPFTGFNSFGMLLASFLLIHPFVGNDGTYWNGPSWSIAVEMWTYLVFAFAVRWAGKLLVPLAVLCSILSCLYLSIATDRYLYVFHTGAMARCLYGFSLGMVGFHLYKTTSTRLSGFVSSVLEIGISLFVVASIAIFDNSIWTLSIPVLFFIAVQIFARQGGVVSRFLLMSPFPLVGALSYSIYMTHMFIEYRVVNLLEIIEKLSHHHITLTVIVDGQRRVGATPLVGDVASIMVLVVTIGIAWLSYRWIERPGQRWSRRIFLGERAKRSALIAEVVAPTF